MTKTKTHKTGSKHSIYNNIYYMLLYTDTMGQSTVTTPEAENKSVATIDII